MIRKTAKNITEAMGHLTREGVIFSTTKLHIGSLSFYSPHGEELARYTPCVEELVILD